MVLRKRKGSFGLGFLAAGVIFLLGAGFHFSKTMDFYYVKDSSEAEATITQIYKRKNSSNHIVYVSFELNNGESHTSLLNIYTAGMAVGDSVKIIYDRNNPDEIILYGSSPRFAAAFGIIGAACLLGSGYYFRKVTKNKTGETRDLFHIADTFVTEATITHIEVIKRNKTDVHTVYVLFELNNGEPHTGLSNKYVEGMAVGDNVKVIYAKDNPDKIFHMSPTRSVKLNNG